MQSRNSTRTTSPFLWLFVAMSITVTGCRWGAVGQNTVGVQLFQQGRFPEALQQFEAARISDPSNPDAYYNLASTYHRMGVAQKDQQLLQQAESLYNQCLEMSPNHTACYRGLGVLLVETDRPDKAFKLMKNWSDASPSLSDPKIELAKLHQEFNQTPQAEQYLDEVLAKDPNNAIAWSARGQIREAKGDLAQARQNYMQSLAITSVQPELLQRVAALDIKLGQQAFNNTVAAAQANVASVVAPTNTTVPSTANSTTPPATPRY